MSGNTDIGTLAQCRQDFGQTLIETLVFKVGCFKFRIDPVVADGTPRLGLCVLERLYAKEQV